MDKIKFICTKEQWEYFRVHTCPAKFDPSWKDIYSQNCELTDGKTCHVCPACWDKYVEFIDADSYPSGETALSPILVGDGYSDGYPVYEQWLCPKCDTAHDIDDNYDYCPDCGQKIDWEDEE